MDKNTSQLSLLGSEIKQFNIFNAFGQLIKSGKSQKQNNVSDSPTGVYIFEYIDKNNKNTTINFLNNFYGIYIVRD